VEVKLHTFLTLEVRPRIAKGYWPDGRGSIPSKGKKFFLLDRFQTGSGAHPESYPMATG
jgi:hypothetical protein